MFYASSTPETPDDIVIIQSEAKNSCIECHTPGAPFFRNFKGGVLHPHRRNNRYIFDDNTPRG